MGVPISLRLDDAVRSELEAEARSRGIRLVALLRDLAAAARDVRRARIRQASERVGSHVTQSADAASLFVQWGTSRADLGDG